MLSFSKYLIRAIWLRSGCPDIIRYERASAWAVFDLKICYTSKVLKSKEISLILYRYLVMVGSLALKFSPIQEI